MSYPAEEQIKTPGAMEELDRELERLENALAALNARVGPVSENRVMVDLRSDVPMPEPSTQLRGRIERLRSLNAELDRITSSIDL